MPEPVSLLMLQFLAWVAERPRTYTEAIDAWRSHCPRHTVWDDALADRLIYLVGEAPVRQLVVTLTPEGRALLDAARQP